MPLTHAFPDHGGARPQMPLPCISRPEAVQARLRDMLAADLTLMSADRPMSAELLPYGGQNLRLAQLRFSAHFTSSQGGPPRPDVRVLVSLHQRGDVFVSQGGRGNSIGEGDIFVLDPCRPFSISTGEMEARSVYLPRATMLALVPGLEDITAQPIPGGHGPGAVLRAAIDALFDSAPSMKPETADRMADALPHLLAPAILDIAGEQSMPSRIAALHKEQIRRHVHANLGDHRLDPSSIAEAVRLSPRHVHGLFEDEQEPLMKWVWTLRLERCHRDLAEPRLARRTISEIAYAWGFSDISHFSRSFKARYGASPREFRRGSVSAEAAGG
ncbi:helix-turn-helix domain-containing protein [Ramlibacter sp. AW1]|uniref:Helix-turn-helix domain-containing protein n=1 Tax=Ramlibacter aurantiacus TaxID=2801330 RepID=A0A936ZTT0_9BURK|nr:helix-turn-helix domain-containing protein [Ramlibacter aurantiacus]MBL0423348.1 helix-turn-helix domain-containing protein [Ramlibacter aurantiacus]